LHVFDWEESIMRYVALATDYDDTLASHGAVAEPTWEKVQRLRESGRKLILVTGRVLDDLKKVCPRLELFDRIVAENGGLLYRPATREEKVLGPAPPEEFIDILRRHNLPHLEHGRTLVGTVQPYETVVLQAIRDLGLELQVIFNKGSVMVLPSGVNKATGLQAALDDIALSPHNIVGVGDAENDHAFLNRCECAVAVAGALPKLKETADFVTARDAGEGVGELIEELLADDLAHREPLLGRHHILLGRREDDREVRLPAYASTVLVAGRSGSGKSTVTTGFLERLAEAGYQFCVIDPEGDYGNLQEAIVLGDTEHAPSVEEVLQLLRQPRQNVVVNLLHIPLADRPLFCAGMLSRLQELRALAGRPHWLVFDEAHHLFPANWKAASVALPKQLETALLITVHPEQVSAAVLEHVNNVVAVGDGPGETLAGFARAVHLAPPKGAPATLEKGDVLTWFLDSKEPEPFVVKAEPGHTERRRHSRKYAEGLLIPERCFYFRGPRGALNLRAHNLILFLEMAQGVDDDTWLHHFRQGDYSRWFREGIGDKALAEEARKIEDNKNFSAAEGRERIRQVVERHYTLADNPAVPKPGPANRANGAKDAGSG
jgi:hydroxymethylpyrimidine pyrophosphatase-like HAD family hydrolase